MYIVELHMNHSPNLVKMKKFSKKDFKTFQKTVKDLMYKHIKPVIKSNKLAGKLKSNTNHHILLMIHIHSDVI